MGGVARRATEVKALRASSAHFLLLDAGNSLSNEYTTTAEVAIANGGQTAVQALNRLGYDAVALGNLDLNMGPDELKKRIGEAQGFEFVSANVVDKATGQLLVKPYVIKEVGGHRVALVGITGDSDSPDFTVNAAPGAAKTYVEKARAEADIVILLSNAGAEMNKMIASQVPGIDLIISGGKEPLTAPVEPKAGTLVVQAEQSTSGEAGRMVAQLDVTFDRSGNLTGHNWQVIQMTAAVADDPDMAAWLSSLPKAQPVEPPPEETPTSGS